MPKPDKIKQIAAVLKVGKRHVQKLIDSGDPRVAEAEKQLESIFALDEKIRLAQLRKLDDVHARHLLDVAEKEGRMISREEVYARETTLAAKTNAILLSRLVSEIPPLIAGLDAASIRAEMEKLHARICGEYKKFAEEWK